MNDEGCANCKHLNRDTWSTCEAFPDGIPWPVMAGDVAHFEPLPGDHGIQFEPLPEGKQEEPT